MRSEVGSQTETEMTNKNGKSLLTLRAFNMIVRVQLSFLRNQVNLNGSVDVACVQRRLNHSTSKYAGNVSSIISRVAYVEIC